MFYSSISGYLRMDWSSYGHGDILASSGTPTKRQESRGCSGTANSGAENNPPKLEFVLNFQQDADIVLVESALMENTTSGFLSGF